MTEEKKKQHFYLIIGNTGLILILIAILRYYLILNDMIGEALSLLGFICLGSFFRYLETKFISSKKEKRIYSWVFNTVAIIILIVFLYFNFHK